MDLTHTAVLHCAMTSHPRIMIKSLSPAGATLPRLEEAALIAVRPSN